MTPMPADLTKDDLDRLEELLKKATPLNQWGAKGWMVMGPSGDTAGLKQPQWWLAANGVGTWPIAWVHERDDADYLNALANAAPALIAAARERDTILEALTYNLTHPEAKWRELETLRADNERLRAKVRPFSDALADRVIATQVETIKRLEARVALPDPPAEKEEG